MPLPIAFCSSFALVAGLCLPWQKQWKPLFDYTNLPPSNEALWKPLLGAQVQMEDALKLAAESEGESMRLLSAELRTGESGAFWDLRVFRESEGGSPKRIDLQVSAAEPKVLRRVELLSLTEDEKTTWTLLAKSQVAADVAIEMAKAKSGGIKTEPLLREPRMRRVEFVAEAGSPTWDCELMGDDWRKAQLRRYQYSVNALKPAIKRFVLLDRFAGEPDRSGVPTELENGMVLLDLTVGEGAEVTADSRVKVNYRLFLLDNTKLHDTYGSKRPETFVVASAPLKGMTAGMVGMRVGGKRKIAIPYELAFGEAGNELAPPRAMVVCDVAVVSLASE